MSTWRILAALAIMLGLLLALALWWRPADDLQGRTLLVWTSDNNPARTDQIATFNRENPQDKLELDYSDKGIQKILLQCSSGVGPDIFDIYGDGELQTYVESGVLWDLTEVANQQGFSAGKETWPGLQGSIMYQGRQYAYPCNIGTNILIYNKNVFDYYGVAYPDKIETWDQLVELGRKVSTEGTGRSGPDGPIYSLAQISWQDFFASQRGEFFDLSGHLLSLPANAQLRKALEWHRDLLFKYKLTRTSMELQTMGGQGGWGGSEFNQFASGRFAMLSAGNFTLLLFSHTHAEQMKALAAAGQKVSDIRDPLKRPLRLGCVLVPGFAGQPPCYRAIERLAGINAYSPHRQEALAFLRYLAGADYSSLINRDEDCLPGNPKYTDLGVLTKPSADDDDMDVRQIHQLSTQAMAFAYTPRNSPYLLSGAVYNMVQAEISRLESNPEISIDDLLNDAQRQLDRLLQRNLRHNPALKAQYEQSYAGPSAKPVSQSL